MAGLVREPEERARHLAAAATDPDERVAAALEQGAAQARARGAPAAAAELSEQAAELTPADRENDRCRRQADAGYFHFASGDSRRALGLLEEVVAQLPAGAERAKALTRLARVRSHCDDLQAATDLFLQAADEAGDDRALRARALEGAAAQLFRQRRRLEEAVEHAETAAALARELDDGALLALALGSRASRPRRRTRSACCRSAATLEERIVLQPQSRAGRILGHPEWTAAIARMWWEEPERRRPTAES